MICFPHAKINLGLHVISKRDDGYHTIETCFYPIPLTDILEVIPAGEFAFSTSGIPIPGNVEQNLCITAYYLLKQDCGIPPVKMHLHKIIPTGAGLGGGSSDGAFTLRLLNDMFQLKLDVGTLSRFAAELGSDCPFFLQNLPMIGRGKGEVLRDVSVNLKGRTILVVKPALHISTQEAYAGVKTSQPERTFELSLNQEITTWRALLKNDFEDLVFKKLPVIGQLKSRLYNYGAIYASMTGSGSAVYGIFDHLVDLKNEFPDCSYWSAML